MAPAKSQWVNKQTLVLIFSSTAIALYGYDQGMMSLINTNYDYLQTMNMRENSPLVGMVVSVYYLGCAAGAVVFSALADRLGRKRGMFACVVAASVGNLVICIAGLQNWESKIVNWLMGTQGGGRAGLVTMFLGRIIMGLGVGGIDSVVPTYSSELSETDGRGSALAKEFQMNIFGLNMAYGINLGITIALGKYSQWAWRTPIIIMQTFAILLMALAGSLPESPRWLVYHDRHDDAAAALQDIYASLTDEDTKNKLEELVQNSQSEGTVTYRQMVTPNHAQFHPTVVTIMGQINQACTGYGAVSVYGPQIFELLGFAVRDAEYLTAANYLSYLALMTFAWLLIDAVGRRALLVYGSIALTACFSILTVTGGLSRHSYELNIPALAPAIPGTITLFLATGAFGIGWLVPPWLIPSEIYPTTARARGTAISVILWGFCNFAVTLATPIMFENFGYFLFAVFAITNLMAGAWTKVYLPESGGRSFEENQRFFEVAGKEGTWKVKRVGRGEWLTMPKQGGDDQADGDRSPLLGREQSF